MKFPWYGPGSEAADMEALQTDVMRFVAILGLCLVAIFSLVQSARIEQEAVAVEDEESRQTIDRVRAPETATPTRTTSPSLAPTTTPVQRAVDAESTEASAPEATLPAEEIAAAREEKGFTLEFASTEAMLSVLRADRVKLYARVGESFWLLDGKRGFTESEPPAAYYQMTAETVPATLRRAFPVSGSPTWGVTLPDLILGEINATMARHQAGRLLINAEGRVVLETPGVN